MEHEASILPDYKFLMWVQMGIFLLTYVALRMFVFKPYLNLVQAREAKTDGLKDQAHEQKLKGEEYRQNYESKMLEGRREINAWVDGQKRLVADKQKAVLVTARDQAAKELNQIRTENEGALDKARIELSPMVGEFSSELVSKLVGHKVKLGKAGGDPVVPRARESAVQT